MTYEEMKKKIVGVINAADISVVLRKSKQELAEEKKDD